jgi:hypothetical protein
MAGGDVKGGQTIGATDEIGPRGVGERYHVHHENGRVEGPTITSGAVSKNLTT